MRDQKDVHSLAKKVEFDGKFWKLNHTTEESTTANS